MPAQNLACPECGAPMILRQGPHSMFYGCSRFPQCRAAHGAHQDGTPLGIPATEETKRYRMAAHKVFDALWRQGPLSRNQAYTWMAQVMGMTPEEAHIGRFTKEQCVVLIRAAHQHGMEIGLR